MLVPKNVKLSMANSSKLGRGLDIFPGQASSSEKSDNNLKILGINEFIYRR
jgi:hypothetical protein